MIKLKRIVYLLLCTTARAMGPWDQDYIGKVCLFAAMYYSQSNKTKGPRLYWEGLSICCYVRQTGQWDHGTKIKLGRLVHLLLSTTDRAMGPWDQDYIGKCFPFAAMYYRQSNWTVGPRLYWGGLSICCHVLLLRAMGPWDQDYIWKVCPFAAMYNGQGNGTMGPRLYWEGLSICCYVLQTGQWNHVTKITLGRLVHLLLSTTDRAMGPCDQDYIGEARTFAAKYYR
jgi:hypothetical protein